MAVKSTYTQLKQLENKNKLLELFVDSPFIIRYFGDDITIDADQDNQETLNIFLEYASSGSLADLIASSNHGLGLLESQVKQYAKAILRGVQCIHEKGIVHYDLKPENILLVKEGKPSDNFVPEIVEFGVAKKADDLCSFLCVKGTNLYWPPKCVDNQKKNARTVL